MTVLTRPVISIPHPTGLAIYPFLPMVIFFSPRTFAACGFSLAEAFNYRGWRAPGKGPIRILDLGCGSGASSFALLSITYGHGE